MKDEPELFGLSTFSAKDEARRFCVVKSFTKDKAKHFARHHLSQKMRPRLLDWKYLLRIIIPAVFLGYIFKEILTQPIFLGLSFAKDVFKLLD